MNILSFVFPILTYVLYKVFPSDLLIGCALGLYVVCMHHSSSRRKIALVHLLCIFFKPLAIFAGLAFALTRHDEIQPLCPLPKTRMVIMASFVALGYFMTFIPLGYVLNGLLMGFYVWMKERLNDTNRQLVTQLSLFVALGFLFIFNFENPVLIYWALFVEIIQICKVKFI